MNDRVTLCAARVAAAYEEIARVCGQAPLRLDEPHADAWLARPENRMLSQGISVHRVPERMVSRFDEAAETLLLGALFPDSPSVAFHLREAFEWRALRALDDAPCSPDILRLLARVTAALWVHVEPERCSQAIRDGLPANLQRLVDEVPRMASGADALSAVAEALREAGGRSLHIADIEETLRRAGTLLMPGEALLTLGGDSRLRLDRELRLNKYGCSPMPRPAAVTFASCTATSISDLAFHRAETARRQLLLRALHVGLLEATEAHAQSVRTRIEREFDIRPDTDVVLAPSGTDCELLLTALAQRTGSRAIVHVAVGFDEAGSGTTSAANGCHFDVLTPRGESVHKDAPLEGMDRDPVTLCHVSLRDERGAARGLGEIDATVTHIVDDAVSRDRHVMLHVMDSSKTGLGGPSLDTARALAARQREQLWVVVDAAQMRASRTTLRRYDEAGCITVLTGSKFFTGPPFAGAVTIPAWLAAKLARLDRLPPGLCSYFSRIDLPRQWQGWLASTGMACNPGLLLRWEASLAEIEAFHAVPDEAKRDYFCRFRDGVLRLFESFPALEPLPTSLIHEGPEGEEAGWDCVQTIFPFLARLRHDRGGGALRMEDAVRLYHFLNADLGAHLRGHVPPQALELAAKACHIGQPVAVRAADGSSAGALRIAPGARFAARVHFDPLLGATPRERLERQLDDVRTVLRKIDVVLEHWALLPDMRPRPSMTSPYQTEICD